MLDAQHNDLLRGLTPAELERVVPLFTAQEFAAGQTILHRGEVVDRLYVIDSGFVSVSVPGPNGADTVVSQLGPGQVFGEMAILTGERRSAEVRALVNTVVYGLAVSSFFEVAGRSPAILLNISQVLAARLGRSTRASSSRERRGLVVLAGPVQPLIGSLIAAELAVALALVSGRRAMLLDLPAPRAAPLPGRAWSPRLEDIRMGEDALVELSRIDLGQFALHAINLPTPAGPDDHDGARLVARTLDRLTRRTDFLVVNLTGPYGAWLDRIAPMATHLRIVAASDAVGPGLTDLVRRCRAGAAPSTALGMIVAASNGSTPEAIRECARTVLGVPESAVLPSQAELLREMARAELPLTLRGPRLAASKILTRVAREVAGLRVGVAFGSGAARGVAHVGVIAALERIGVPIDVVAGTSVGAVVAAGVAMGMGRRQMEQGMDRLVDLWGAGFKPIASRLSLMSAKALERIVEETAGDVRFEELPIPCGVVASDLDSGRPVYINHGPIASALRGSISIPMFFPPHALGGLTLVDGFVHHPVPTELTRMLGADIVLASNVSQSGDELTPLEYAESADGQPAAKPRRGSLISTYLRCAEIMMSRGAEHDCLTADVVFRSRLPQASSFKFDRSGYAARAGERAVEEQIGRLRELFPWLRAPL